MRKTSARLGATLVASAVAAVGLGGAMASPASAQRSGLTFYSGQFATEIATFPASGACTALPATADSHIGWSGVRDVVFYGTADCTGQATGVGTLRTYEAGRWQSFRALA